MDWQETHNDLRRFEDVFELYSLGRYLRARRRARSRLTSRVAARLASGAGRTLWRLTP